MLYTPTGDGLTRNGGLGERDDETFLYCFCCDGKGIGNEIQNEIEFVKWASLIIGM